uniref:Uncharacterized protein n=1 Tax=Arundo donax TaxID=35708 RepID=A0A0A9C6I1_ARUDO
MAPAGPVAAQRPPMATDQ